MRFPVFLLCILPLVAAWTYEDTNSWSQDYPACAGSHQSPISVNTKNAVKADLPALQFKHYDEAFSTPLTISNNGHTIEFNIPTTVSGAKPSISGGLLNGEFEAQALHFHWGSLLKQGSEHEINGKRYPLEMHIVHKNSKYATIDEAQEYEDGLAVVGVVFEFKIRSGISVPGLEAVQDVLGQVESYKSTAVSGEGLTLGSFLGSQKGHPFINGEKFLTYQGSLTTPPCSEAVTWHLFEQTLPVSPLQLFGFWNIKEHSGKRLVNNYRPVQPIGERQVYVRTA